MKRDIVALWTAVFSLLDCDCHVTTLRRFRNADIPHLLQTWTAHFAAAGLDSRMAAAAFEQAIMNRMFFDPQRLIVAVQDEVPIGMAQWMGVFSRSQEAVIPAICVRPGPTADAVGLQLLAHCEQAAREADCAVLLGGTDSSHISGYGGLSPLGPGEGIVDADRRAVSWFLQSGYTPLHRIGRYSVTLATFRPPIDRAQMQLRRSTTFGHEVLYPSSPRRAAALSHADVERFTTRTRGGDDVAWAEFHLSDPEAQVFPTGLAILADWASSEDDQGAAARYTISAALQQLCQRGLRRVEAVASDAQPDRAVILRSLRFHLDAEGTVFSKRL